VQEPLAARIFQSMADAEYAGILECQIPVQDWRAMPITIDPVPAETRMENERIVTAAAREWMQR
jgi:hypothetical protein